MENEIGALNGSVSNTEKQLDIKGKEIIAYVDDRIWKAELEICNSLKNIQMKWEKPCPCQRSDQR